jgi:peptidoglycan-associated lipoprotein
MPALAPVDEYTRLRSMTADELERLGLLHDIHFDFDRWDIREDARPLLARNAEVLRRFDFIHVTVQGHCDARGTVDYNLALGARRAEAARDYLVSLGVSQHRLRTASYGKEAPLCEESTEECWQRNRRASPSVTGNAMGR